MGNSNLGSDRRKIRLIFETPKRHSQSLFDWGFVIADFRGDALIEWMKEGIEGKGFVRLPDGRLLVFHNGAEVIGAPLKRGAFGTLHLQFIPDNRKNVGARVFELDVVDIDEKGRPIGGQRFLLKTTLGLKRPCLDTQLNTFDGVDWISKEKGGCGCGTHN